MSPISTFRSYCRTPFEITKHIGYEEPIGDPVRRFFRMWQKSVAGGAISLSGSPRPRARAHRTAPIRSRLPNRARSRWASTTWPPAVRSISTSSTPSSERQLPSACNGRNGCQFSGARHRACHRVSGGGALAKPPTNLIENPNPRYDTNNWYTQSGYSSGSYTNCSDASEPGIAALHRYLAKLPYRSFNDGNCEPGAYYLVNNYNAGFLPTGEPAALGSQVFRIPPQAQPTITEALIEERSELEMVFRREKRRRHQ